MRSIDERFAGIVASIAWRVFFAGLFVVLCVLAVAAWLVGWINPRGILIKPPVRDVWEPVQ